MKAIKATGLEYIYPDGTEALSGVDFEANAGERIAVLGPNGSGKTTLFYHFNGLIRPARGEIQVFGEKIQKENMDMIRERVGLVFQNPDSQLDVLIGYGCTFCSVEQPSSGWDGSKRIVSQVLRR